MVLFNRRKYMRTRRSPQGAPIDIADATITVADSVQYTGTPRTPSVTVVYDGATLVVNQDYYVSYNDNTNLGAATAVVSGAGEFTGQVVKTFHIVEASAVEWDFLVENATFVGSKSTPWHQSGLLLGAHKAGATPSIVGGASVSGNYLGSLPCPLDENDEFHVANLGSSLVNVFTPTSPWSRAKAVSENGRHVLFVSSSNERYAKQYVAETAWNMSTLSYAKDSQSWSDVVSYNIDYGLGLSYANKGRLLIITETPKYVSEMSATCGVFHAIPLMTAYDTSTMDLTNRKVLYINTTNVPWSDSYTIPPVLFDSAGMNMVFPYRNKVYQFALSTPFDITTATFLSVFDSGQSVILASALVVNDGKTLICMIGGSGGSVGTLYEYSLVSS